jgi:hypothetical protein
MTHQLELLSSPFHVEQSNVSFEPRKSFAHAAAQRDEAMRAIVEFAGKKFRDNAAGFVVKYLIERKKASSEEITDAAVLSGIVPLDQRHFGPVFMSLARAGKITKAGSCHRRKGHGTSGGVIWRLA